MCHIVCVGQRTAEDTSAGQLVYDQLSQRELPSGVELLDGGAPGLDFFKLVKESAFLVFVDTVSGTSRPGEVVLIRDTEQVLTQLSNAGQGIGPANRSDLMDLMNGKTGAEVVLVGLVPPVSNVTLWRAAEMSLVLADGESESADKPRIAWTA